MTNDAIADQFAMLAKLMELHGEQAFRAKSYAIAAYNIEQLPRPIADISETELFASKGIGDSIGKKILEIQQTGSLKALQDIIAKTPPGVLDMMQVKGLGPKKLAIIWKEMGIESLGELEYACTENRLASVKGFGQKTQQAILDNLHFIKKSQGFLLWADAEMMVNSLLAQLKKGFPLHQFLPTGAFRRQLETIDCLPFVTEVATTDLKNFFAAAPGTQFQEEAGYLQVHTDLWPRLIFYIADQDEMLPRLLFETTGPDAFVAEFNQKYPAANHPDTEEALFVGQGLSYIPPALRDHQQVLEMARLHEIPELIQPQDIRGIIHSHSTWSDGAHTLEQMALAARDAGYEYLVISDHSQAAYYAKGLSPERILEQHAEIDALNQRLAPFRIFKSIEADILNDGSLDYDESVLASFDLVIASVHSNLRMSAEKAMERVLTAVRNPFTTILGHATGRLLLSREGYPIDHKKLIDTCAAYDVVIEINAHPRRLDLDWRWVSYALEKGVLLSVNPDAHAIEGFADTRYGVLAGQKGGLTASRNLSSFSLEAFEAFVSQYKAKRGR